MRPAAPRLTLVLALLLAGCASPAADGPESPAADPAPLVDAAPDPLAAGPYGVEEVGYDLGTALVGGPDPAHSEYEYEARLRGILYLPDGDGPFPLAVFLHGQHNTCGMMGEEAFVSLTDCSSEGTLTAPYPNHLGYGYLGHHLASHGIAVASMLGYEVNNRNGAGDVGMWARGENILATLDALAAARRGEGDADAAVGDAVGRLDLSRVGLMGHSRGGEGVVTAVHANLARPEGERWPLRAVVALAPTDFNARGVPDVAFLSMVPYCDGDVYNLHGLRTYDHTVAMAHNVSTAKVQALVHGANHNHYNTRWGREVAEGVPVARGDDALPGRHANVECDLPPPAGGRLTMAETLAESTLHIGSFLRWTLLDDASLGPYLTGAAPTPAAACPAAAQACPGAVLLSAESPRVQAIWRAGVQAGGAGTGEDREGNGSAAGRAGPLVDAPRATGFTTVLECAHSDCAPSMYSSATVLGLQWTGDASLRFDGWNATPPGMDVLTFRIAVPDAQAAGGSPPLSVRLALVLANGTVEVELDDPALQPAPGVAVAPGGAMNVAGSRKLALSAVRVSLAELGIASQDLRAVQLDFAPRASGAAFVTDLLLQDEPAAWAQPGGASTLT